MPTQKQLFTIVEFALRLYIAYFLIDYGISKFTGDMFNNTSEKVLHTELIQVDLFHLTWYWFQQNALLSYFIAIVQIVSAVLIVINRTVLLGCLIAFPILLGTFLIDLYCVRMPELTIRLFLYNLAIIYFCYYRREAVTAIIRLLTTSPSAKDKPAIKYYFLAVPIIFLMLFLIEFLTLKGEAFLLSKVS